MIRRATEEDLVAVLGLLESVSLPSEGVAENIRDFVVAEESGELQGCAGLERHGRLGLLRSVAVRREAQGRQLGSALVERVLRECAETGVGEVVLLTTTAQRFFGEKHGFAVRAREEYDAVFASSMEWRLPLCSSAVVMGRRVG